MNGSGVHLQTRRQTGEPSAQPVELLEDQTPSGNRVIYFVDEQSLGGLSSSSGTEADPV